MHAIVPGMNEISYLEKLLGEKGIRKETLRLGLYFLIKLIGKKDRTLIKQGRMAEFLELAQPNVSRAIGELVALGFISKKPSKDDARRASYMLEPLKGAKPATKAGTRAAKATKKTPVRKKARR